MSAIVSADWQGLLCQAWATVPIVVRAIPRHSWQEAANIALEAWDRGDDGSNFRKGDAFGHDGASCDPEDCDLIEPKSALPPAQLHQYVVVIEYPDEVPSVIGPLASWEKAEALREAESKELADKYESYVVELLAPN